MEGTQWITADVELPQEVVEAHAEGRVVFFVGAGASVAPPASLPIFKELAKSLGAEAGVPYVEPERGEAEALDHFLGRLTHLSPPYAVHERVHALLTPGTSSPNAMHAAIVRLAAAYGHLRIVTTNFDDHLAVAATSVGVTINDKWIGPALPLGDTVSGLVHLHGSVTRGHAELVLTDRDLGVAYLSDAWATRFLLKLFQANVVVFVGYGLADPTLRYLTLGLPSGARLYAFTRRESATDPEWVRLGVRTISFGDDFDNLRAALEAWDTRARMGQLDHRSRVESIVAAGPSLTPVDRDYLSARLREADGVRDFVNATDSLSDDLKLAWLRWIEDLPEFRRLFAPAGVTDTSAMLGTWFARTFIASPDLHGAALQTVQRIGQSMTESLYRTACWLTEELSKSDSIAGERWRAFLSTSIVGQSAPPSSELVLPYLPDVGHRSTSVLRPALRPLLKLERRWFVTEDEATTAAPDAKVTWSAEEYALTQHLLLAVNAADAGDPSLGGALVEALMAAYDLLGSYHGDRDWDSLSHGRSAIEPHPQDEIRQPLDAVIDALREFGRKGQQVRPDLPDQWWALQRPLFRRIALHLIASDTSRSSDDKINWLLSRTGLYEDHLKHESYQLLAAGIADASDALKQSVLDAVDAGPEYPDDTPDRERHLAYARFNILVWLTEAAPEWEAAAAALEALQRQNPSFAPREHPDLDNWITSGTWGGRMPLTVEDFTQALQQDTAAALDDLLSRDYSERSFDEPTWRDALELVVKTVGTTAGLGVGLWDEVGARGDLGDKTVDLHRAIAEGWGKAELGDDALRAIERVATLVADQASAHAVGRFLLDQVRAQIDTDEAPAFVAMRELAQRLWRAHGESFTHRAESSPLSFAPLYLNSWPGFLAQYWLSEIDRRWRHHREDWNGLSDQERNALLEMLSGPRAALDAIQPALAGELFFLFAADAAFATDHLVPLFLADETAAFAWYPYLHRPRYTDRLLGAGLLDATIAEWSRLGALGEHSLKRQFFGLVTSMLSYAGITAEQRQALLRQSVLASNGAHAVGFAEAVARFVREDGTDGAEVWEHWLREHLTDRLHGIPRTADVEELTAWAEVVPSMGEHVPEAVELFKGKGARLGEAFFSRDFQEGVLATHGDALVAHYAERIRNSDPTNFIVARRVRGLIEAFRTGVGDVIAQPLIDAATEQGFGDGLVN
jgi:hypothetical protein